MTRFALGVARRQPGQLLLLAVFVIAALAVVVFGVRTYRSYTVLQSARQLGDSDVGTIRGWMTVRHIARTYHVPELVLMSELGLPPATDPNTPLTTLASRSGKDTLTYVQEVQRAVVELHRAPPAPPQPPQPPQPPPLPGGGRP